jgi:3-oxoacyl-[acyl-carrier-protein] synthase I
MAVPDRRAVAHIVGIGASTPLGSTVWASAAAARAGVCGFTEHPFVVDTVGEPMRVAAAPWLEATLLGTERYWQLIYPAIDEALAAMAYGRSQEAIRIGLFVALPPDRAGRPSDLAPMIRRLVSDRYGRQFEAVVAFETGHAAGYAAFDAATRNLMSSTGLCMVVGVDSYLSPETLEWIEACDQLNGAGRMNNAWGFIPGEAAGAVLLGSSRFVESAGMPVLGDLIGLGLAREANRIKTDSVCIAEGLTLAFRIALNGLEPHECVTDVFCDLNGEPYRADEYGFAALRTREQFRSASAFVAPAECWGDVGAAGATLLTALSVIAQRKQYARGPLALVCGSSESGERGAALIAASSGT